MKEASTKVLVAMSGGVDSSTAAALLVKQGFDVVGATMRLPVYGDAAQADTGSRGDGRIEDARRTAEIIGIPFHVLDLRREFEESVVRDFCDAYSQGRTPNPCVRCNQWIKFGKLLQEARAMGAEFVATGHYVRKVTDERTGHVGLKTGKGQDDQSYFLFRLSQEQLGQALFPLGEHDKEEVRRTARNLGLPVHDRPDSQDLCFLPDGQYRSFLKARRPAAFRTGPIVHVSGKVLGQHEGIGSYTIGQRRGLGIAHPEPLYVVGFERERNAVVVGEKEHLFRRAIDVGEVNWIAAPPALEALPARVKIRYNHCGAEAQVMPLADGRVRVEFAEAQEAPCPGQAAVFYRGDVVLGGGMIENTSGTMEE